MAGVEHPTPAVHTAALTAQPRLAGRLDDLNDTEYQDVTLEQILAIAMENSDVLRELGGTVLKSPDAVTTRYDPALAVLNPRFGAEAALAAFDTQLRSSAYFTNTDRTFNNPFFAGGTNAFKQDYHEYTLGLTKQMATGSRMTFRTVANHDANNAPGNIFRSAWDTYVEGEMRQPLLQGGGLQFSRIAGIGSTPGAYNGVLLARVSQDVSRTDFETAVRDYISNVINAYWDLYFAYRDFDARLDATRQALEAWNRISARQIQELESGAREAMAREQYFRFRADLEDSLTGRITQGTRNRNGAAAGTLEGTSGVQVAERRLRLLIGMPITDRSLLRPASEPPETSIAFDWNSVMHEALCLRPELRRQELEVRRRELELLASRNFMNPRLDAVGRYRFRGFGDDLIRTSGTQTGTAPVSALGNLASGRQQEWYLGMEYSVPLGYRQARLAVEHAETAVRRSRLIQREQQREVIHNLSNAVADASRAYESCRHSLNRYLAAVEVLQAYQAQDENDLDIDVDHLLDAQRRTVEARSRSFRARTEYALALKNVHFEKGSLLALHTVVVVDEPTPGSITGTAAEPQTAEQNEDVAPRSD